MKLAAFITIGVTIMIMPLSANIDDKIESNQVKIDKKKAQEKKISHQLDQIAKEISQEQKNLKKLTREIESCKQTITKLKKKTLIKGSELQKIEKVYKALTKKEKLVSKKVVSILSKELSIEMITKGATDQNGKHVLESYETNIDNIIMNEVLHTYTTLLRQKFHKTKSKYIKLNKSIDLVKKEIAKLSNKVDALKVKKADLDKLKKSQKRNIYSLKEKKKHYIAKLNRIKKEQNLLSSTLHKLHVTKEKQDKTIIKESADGKVNVRQIGSSYQHGKLVKYRGPKTIAPLKSYTVTQKFGNYTDPIYKIKIFNESVILRASKQNAKVRNVLNGTVIYAEKTPILDNVIIVKHKNNLHTIYAHLSQIAPTIRVGKRVKKGYVLGRVHRELTFEVTQDTKHINPMRLIK
jgi:murein DD-endopeptidase MepM/ murein hydrolase activator NlpD